MSHLLPGYELGQEVDITFRAAQVTDIGGNFIDVELSDGEELTVLPGADGVEVTPAGSRQAAELSLASIEQQLGPLTPEETSWVLGRLAVTAPSALAEALTALAERRAETLPPFEAARTPPGEVTLTHHLTPSVRGGPDIGPDADDEFRREQDDHNPEEKA